MPRRFHLCSGPEEILSHIIEYLQSPDHLIYDDSGGQTIRFANYEVISLSQVNHLFRRLSLPLLYKRIFISLPTANDSTDVLPFDLFRRTMERKPHLACLVRVIEVEGYYSRSHHHVFDSLPFLPKIKQIHFPLIVKLDLDFLSAINSHTSLLTVLWDTIDAFSFPYPLSLPHGALSHVLIDHGDLSGDSNPMELLWLYFTKLGLRVKKLTITGTTPPRFLSLTYPDLSSIGVYVPPIFSSDSPEPLWWFPSFLERHPRLEFFWIEFRQGEGCLPWEALKNIPIMRPLSDASHSRGLISSFSITSIRIEIERFSFSSAFIDVNSPRKLPQIIHLLGSLLPIPVISLRFRTLELHVLPFNVNEFVSAFQENHKTLSSLSLRAVHRVLDLDSLSIDEELHLHDPVTIENVRSNSGVRVRTKRLAQLTRLLSAGLPQLKRAMVKSLVMVTQQLDRNSEMLHAWPSVLFPSHVAEGNGVSSTEIQEIVGVTFVDNDNREHVLDLDSDG